MHATTPGLALLLALLSGLGLGGAATAQQFEEGLAAAAQKAAVEDWDAALDRLLLLKDTAATPAQLELLATRLYDVGDRLLARAAHDGALRSYRASLALHQRLGDADDVAVALCHNNIGMCLHTLGRPAEARPCYELALAMQQRLFGGAAHAHSVITLGNLGDCLLALGEIEPALQQRRAALAMEKELHQGEDHVEVAASLHRLAFLFESLGRPGEALALYQECLAMRQRLFGPGDHELVANTTNSIGTCIAALGRGDGALRHYEAALAMRQRLHGDADDADVVASLVNLGGLRVSLGRAGEALPLLEAALAMSLRLRGEADHREVVRCRNGVALCLRWLGRSAEALPHLQAALAMLQRLHADNDHADVALTHGNVAATLRMLGRDAEALRHSEAALAMRQRLCGGADHREVANAMDSVAEGLTAVGRAREALPLSEDALAMRVRLLGEGDHPDIGLGLNNLGTCLHDLGRLDQALARFETALAMTRRLQAGRDHPDTARTLNNVARCLRSLGRFDEAMAPHEEALAMQTRLFGTDHPDVANSLDGIAATYLEFGAADQALPRFEAALAIWRRLHGEADSPDVARALSNLGVAFAALGRADEGLVRSEAALAMTQRLSAGDHHDVAAARFSVATRLAELGRRDEALVQYQASLAMYQRLFGDAAHPNVAEGHNSVGACLHNLGRAPEAVASLETSLAMWRRLFGERDHPSVALCTNNLGRTLYSLGRLRESRSQLEAALAMRRRLYGDRDTADIARSLFDLSDCLQAAGESAAARTYLEQSCTMIERLRADSRVSAALRQSVFDALKGCGAFERLQQLAATMGQPAAALQAAERGRGRELLDLLAQQQFDPLDEAEQRARQRGDDAAAAALLGLRTALRQADLDNDRLLHELTQADGTAADGADAARRQDLVARSSAAATRRRQLLDERARLLGDVLAVGQVRSAAEIQATLRTGELLLEFTITKAVSMLYMVARDGEVEAIPLPTAHATTQRVLDALLQQGSRTQLPARGRDPAPAAAGDARSASHELFDSLIPKALWPRLRACKRVFVAAHRDLHRLPFEMLEVGVQDGRPVYWLDQGPPVAYVPSGSVLHWFRQRARAARDDATALDLLAVGDPGALPDPPQAPAEGALIVAVQDGGQAASLGLRPHDVLVRYDGQPVVDDTAVGELRRRTEQAIAAGRRTDAAIPLEIWRAGASLHVEASKGLLGIQTARGRARAALAASLPAAEQVQQITRSGELERLRQLPPLVGARAETRAIESVFAGVHAHTQVLLGTDATEPAVFAAAARARFLHFACHGIAEEYVGQSLSMLVLSRPAEVKRGDDGLLKLDDLLHDWRGCLSSCRLVVLSACRTNVGPTLRDEAPQALPVGFLFAGAPAVISSLWAVDDASTRELMTDFYARLVAGEKDRLRAFTAARKALRGVHPDPFHWAPFLYLGSPE